MSQEYDLAKLRQDAQVRWLKTEEILFVLQNHERIGFTDECLHKPQSGSLYIFNRSADRHLRNDGHSPRTRPNGIVDENRDGLKIDKERILSCCYTKGNENPFLWRRTYSRTDQAYSHIVLVHYREVSEGLPCSSEHTDPGQSSSSPGSTNRSIVGCSNGKENDNSQQFAGNSGHPTLDPLTIERLKSSDWLRWVQLEGTSNFTDGTDTSWEQEQDDFDINLWSW